MLAFHKLHSVRRDSASHKLPVFIVVDGIIKRMINRKNLIARFNEAVVTGARHKVVHIALKTYAYYGIARGARKLCERSQGRIAHRLHYRITAAAVAEWRIRQIEFTLVFDQKRPFVYISVKGAARVV